MRPIILFSLLLLTCGNTECQPATEPESDKNVGHSQSTSNSEIEIIEIDGHEYIIWERRPGSSSNVGGICHSESCKAQYHY